MANINKITLPSGSTYNLVGTIHNVIGTQTAATGSWTGNLNIPALYDGLTINYYLPYDGSGNATLNLTLADGTTTGAKNCYINTGRLTTHYGAGRTILMTYYSAGSIKIKGTATTDDRWICDAYYDTNDQAYQIRDYYNYFKAGANKIFPYTLIMQCSDGRWESVVTSSNTASTKTKNSHGFRLGQIALMNANATYNENARIGDGNVWFQLTSGLMDHRYSFNTENNSTKGTTSQKPIYLVGTVNSSDGLFYLDDTWWTQTLPTTADGKIYIYLGDAFDYYRMSFVFNHPMYKYTNGMIREYVQDADTVNGLTVQTAVPSGAVFTDTKNTAGSTDTSSKIFLIGATSQAANPQTYSQDTAYVGTDGCLYSGGTKVLTTHQDISGKVNKTGDTMSGDLLFSDSGTTIRQVQGKVGANDYWRVAGGATASNAGWMEIATADDGVEPIYARQYSGVYTTIRNEVTLLDASGNSIFPHNVTVGGSSGATLQYNTTTQSLDFVFA